MIAKVTLLALSLWGFKSLMLFSMENGLAGFFEHIQATGTFPHGEPLAPAVPGWHPTMDWQLKAHVVFLWSFVDGRRPDLALILLGFCGAYGSAWVLIVMESFRRGNRGRLASYILIPGIFIFNHSHAIMTPLYLLLHLFNSPLASKATAEAIQVDPVEVRALLASFAVAYLAPLVIIGLPLPSLISVVHKQTVIAWYQQWNIYIALVHVIVAVVIRNWTSRTRTVPQARCDHRAIYAFGFAVATIPYAIGVVLSLTSGAFPGLFADGVAEMLSPRSVFGTTSPFSGVKASSLADGCKWLLQWDFVVGSLATLCWAASLYLKTRRALGLGEDWRSLVAKGLFLTMISSPAGAAVVLMWERDEMLFAQDIAAEHQETSSVKADK